MVGRYPTPPIRKPERHEIPVSPSESSGAATSCLHLSEVEKAFVAGAVKAATALAALCRHQDGVIYPVDGSPQDRENYFIGIALVADGREAVERLRSSLSTFGVTLPNFWEAR